MKKLPCIYFCEEEAGKIEVGEVRENRSEREQVAL